MGGGGLKHFEKIIKQGGKKKLGKQIEKGGGGVGRIINDWSKHFPKVKYRNKT